MTAIGILTTSVVSSVNTETGAVVLDAGDIGVPGVSDTLTVAEGSTVVVNRPTLIDSGTAADVWRFTYNGQRTGYANEFGILRSRGSQAQVAFRTQCHSSDNGTTQVILDVALASNVTQFSVDALGDARVTRDLYLGRNMILTNAWTAFTYASNILGSNGAPYYDAAARLETGGRVFLRGRVITKTGANGGSYTADATIFTLPAGLRPAATQLYTIRTQGTGAANGTCSIDSSGNFSFSASQALTGSQQMSWQVDGLSFPVAA